MASVPLNKGDMATAIIVKYACFLVISEEGVVSTPDSYNEEGVASTPNHYNEGGVISTPDSNNEEPDSYTEGGVASKPDNNKEVRPPNMIFSMKEAWLLSYSGRVAFSSDSYNEGGVTSTPDSYNGGVAFTPNS